MKHHIFVRSFDLLFAFGYDIMRKKEISEIFMDKYELLNKKIKSNDLTKIWCFMYKKH